MYLIEEDLDADVSIGQTDGFVLKNKPIPSFTEKQRGKCLRTVVRVKSSQDFLHIIRKQRNS